MHIAQQLGSFSVRLFVCLFVRANLIQERTPPARSRASNVELSLITGKRVLAHGAKYAFSHGL